MAGRHNRAEDGPALAEALGEALGGLGSGPEPPMPDLVSGAIAQGTRIRRRRRIGSALGSAAMAAAVMIGGYGVLAPTPEARHSVPAAEPTVWYPSLKLLRSIVPQGIGTVEAAQPQHSRRPATYFRVTDLKSGRVSDLYVSVARSATRPSPVPSASVGCRNGNGPEFTTTSWGGRPSKCSVTRTKAGLRLLTYLVDMKSLPARMDDTDNPPASGVTYVNPGGWEVQVIVGPHRTGENPAVAATDWSVLTGLATDSRLFDAAEKNRQPRTP